MPRYNVYYRAKALNSQGLVLCAECNTIPGAYNYIRSFLPHYTYYITDSDGNLIQKVLYV